MADTRNKPGHGKQEQQGGRGSELDRDRQPGVEQGGITEPERQAGQNPRRTGQEESGGSQRTGTETETETGTRTDTEQNPGRQNAG